VGVSLLIGVAVTGGRMQASTTLRSAMASGASRTKPRKRRRRRASEKRSHLHAAEEGTERSCQKSVYFVGRIGWRNVLKGSCNVLGGGKKQSRGMEGE
jgi:hypothetical protein